jgi:hypothetical protein
MSKKNRVFAIASRGPAAESFKIQLLADSIDREQFIEDAATGGRVFAHLYGPKLASRLRAIPSFFIRK